VDAPCTNHEKAEVGCPPGNVRSHGENEGDHESPAANIDASKVEPDHVQGLYTDRQMALIETSITNAELPFNLAAKLGDASRLQG
jgi:hypothetical protein